MKQLTIICLIVTLLFNFHLYAQDLDYHQQLRKEIDSLNSISYDYIASNTENCEKLFLKNIEKADEINYDFGKAQSMSWLSMIYYFTGKNDQSVYIQLNR